MMQECAVRELAAFPSRSVGLLADPLLMQSGSSSPNCVIRIECAHYFIIYYFVGVDY